MQTRLLPITLILCALLAMVDVHAQDFYTLAKDLYNSKEFDSAVDFIEAKEGPMNAREWKLKGDCYHKLKRYYEANEAYSASIVMNDTDAESFTRRGATYLQMGELGFAISDVKKSLKIMPTLAEGYFNMGNICYDQDDMSGAVKNFKKALEYRPDYSAARYMLGASRSNTGANALAVADFESVLYDYPSAKYNMAVVELENENYPRAVMLLDEMEADGSDTSMDFFFFRAEANYFLGDKEKACRDYLRASEMGDEEAGTIHSHYCLSNKKKSKAKKRETIHLEF